MKYIYSVIFKYNDGIINRLFNRIESFFNFSPLSGMFQDIIKTWLIDQKIPKFKADSGGIK